MEAEGQRYRLVETVRQYAQDKLDDVGGGGRGALPASRVLPRHGGKGESGTRRARTRACGSRASTWKGENLLAAHAWCDQAQDGAELGLAAGLRDQASTCSTADCWRCCIGPRWRRWRAPRDGRKPRHDAACCTRPARPASSWAASPRRKDCWRRASPSRGKSEINNALAMILDELGSRGDGAGRPRYWPGTMRNRRCSSPSSHSDSERWCRPIARWRNSAGWRAISMPRSPSTRRRRRWRVPSGTAKALPSRCSILRWWRWAAVTATGRARCCWRRLTIAARHRLQARGPERARSRRRTCFVAPGLGAGGEVLRRRGSADGADQPAARSRG